MDQRNIAQYLLGRMGTGAGRFQNYQQYHVAENEPAAEFGVPLFHAQHRDYSLGTKVG